MGLRLSRRKSYRRHHKLCNKFRAPFLMSLKSQVPRILTLAHTICPIFGSNSTEGRDDALGRLIAATTNGSVAYAKWGVAETFDQYRNRLGESVTAGSGPSNSLSFSTSSGGGPYTNHPDEHPFDASGDSDRAMLHS